MRITLIALAAAALVWAADDAPRAQIANGPIRAKVYLPDSRTGYYRGTRFDWSGVIYSLEYHGHQFYGPWFQQRDPQVRDFEYRGDAIAAGPASAITGPADEFAPVGFDDAAPGATFVKIGVGALRRPDRNPYDHYRQYEIAVPGKWTIRKSGSAVEFTQELSDPGSHYGYRYRKSVRLEKGKPEMVLEHRLVNTGGVAIRTAVYNHNFLVLDGQGPGPGLTIEVPFEIRTPRPPGPELAAIRASRVVYLEKLKGRDTVAFPLEGFGAEAKDHEIRIESAAAKAGMRITCDRPLDRESLWSIRTVVAMEPFVAISVDPGKEFTWQTRYEYYTLR